MKNLFEKVVVAGLFVIMVVSPASVMAETNTDTDSKEPFVVEWTKVLYEADTLQGKSETNADGIGVVVDNKLVDFGDQAPLMDTKANRVLVPFRAIGEALGFNIEWLNETKQVKFSNDDTTALLTINSKEYTINGETFISDAAPVIVNSRTMVPVRLLAEAFKCSVEWNKTLRIVNISTNGLLSNNAPPRESLIKVTLGKEHVDDGLLKDYKPMWKDYDENGVNDYLQEGPIIRSGHPDDMPDPDSLLGGQY